MSNPPGTTDSTLAITEKRPQRPGGCVGIFFQLFDWNRRSAKKKLFSKKLLPPVRAKKASKRFGVDEKLPATKLLLIAEENQGGFPNAKKADTDCLHSLNDPERNSSMRTPGLIARLMGLESMPTVRRDKPKKASVPDVYYDQEKKSVKQADVCGKTSELFYHDQDSNSEKGQTKADLRPQKLQKTGFFDRRAIPKFGTETLQFRSVLSRSRKQHHHKLACPHKLASPVKSPRILSGRNAARLMDAATKILEPGLQATNRAKCSLTYSASPCLSMKYQASVDGGTEALFSRQPAYSFGPSPLKVHSSCNSCSDFVDVIDSRPKIEDRNTVFSSSASHFSNDFSHGSGKGRGKPPELCSALEIDADGGSSGFVKDQEGVANVQRRTQSILHRKCHLQEDSDQCMPSRQCISQRPVPLKSLKQNNQRQNQLLAVKGKVLPKPKLCSRQIGSDSSPDAYNRAKDCVGMNKNLGSITRTRLPNKILDNCRMDTERNVSNKMDDSPLKVKTLARKRRPMTNNLTVENTGFISSDIGKQQNHRSDPNNRERLGLNARTMSPSHVRTVPRKPVKGNSLHSSKDANIVPFAFGSPMSQASIGTFCPVQMVKRKGRSECQCSTSGQCSVMSDTKKGYSSSRRVVDLKEDALGALLEEKLRELTCSDGDELEMGDSHARRSTASILQELISALNVVRPISEGNGGNCSVGLCSKDTLFDGSPDQTFSFPERDFNVKRKEKTEAEGQVSTQSPLAMDSDHPSPTSILDVSFSNDSNFSGSLDGSSGHRLHQTCMGKPQDHELSDSATSRDGVVIDKTKTGKIASFIGKSSRIYIRPAEISLMGSKHKYARDVIANAELLFKTLATNDADCMGDSVVETLASDILRIPKCGLEFLNPEEGGWLRTFLLDCIVEFLDSKCGLNCNLGFRAWSKLPLFLSRETFVNQVSEEIQRWRCLGGKVMDVIVEMDMSSSGKWADFQVEAFEVGVEIEGDIVQSLLDEVVVDLRQCCTVCLPLS